MKIVTRNHKLQNYYLSKGDFTEQFIDNTIKHFQTPCYNTTNICFKKRCFGKLIHDEQKPSTPCSAGSTAHTNQFPLQIGDISYLLYYTLFSQLEYPEINICPLSIIHICQSLPFRISVFIYKYIYNSVTEKILS